MRISDKNVGSTCLTAPSVEFPGRASKCEKSWPVAGIMTTDCTLTNPEPDDFSPSCQVYGVYKVHNPEPDDFSLSCQVYGVYSP